MNIKDLFNKKKNVNDNTVKIKYSRLDCIGKTREIPIVQKETLDNLQVQIEQLKTSNQQLQNNVNSLQNNLSSVNDKISKLGGPIRIRREIFNSSQVITYTVTQVDIGNNTVLVKFNNLNFTGFGFFYRLKPNTNYLMDIYLDKFQINKGESYKYIQKFIQRRKYTTDSTGELHAGISNYDRELCFFISTEKYIDLVTTFPVNEVHLECLLYEEVVI